MTDPFVELADKPMSSADDPMIETDPAAAAEQTRQMLQGRHVCPYCGQQGTGTNEACPRCTMEDSPATRQATKARIGPWYVLQTRNPSAPGMKYTTLLGLLRRGHITPKSVVRGPTTHQLWRFAAHVRGVSREFGLCYSCGESIDRVATFCPTCQRSQEAPADPDALLEVRGNAQAHSHTHAHEHRAIEPVRDRDLAPMTSRRSSPVRRQRTQQEEAHAAALAVRPKNEIVPRGDGRVVSAMDLAAALRSDPPQELLVPSRKKFKIAMAAMLMICAGGAALLYFRPDYRHKSQAWLNQTWETAKVKWSQIEWPEISVGESKPVRPRTPTPTLAPPVARVIDQPKVIETAKVTEPVKTSEPAPAPAIESPRVAEGAKVIEMPVAPATRPASPPPVDPAMMLAQARTLWNQAMDAEGKEDYSTAIQIYEKIKQLPNDVWPGGLQIRIDLARKWLGTTSSSAAQ